MLKKNGDLASPALISAPGCLDDGEDAELIGDMCKQISEVVSKNQKNGKGKQLEESIRNVMRKTIREELGKTPVLNVHIHQIA